MFKFSVYQKQDNEVVVAEVIELDTADTVTFDRLRELNKKSGVLVAPSNEASALELMTKKGRQLDWSVPVLTDVLQHAVDGVAVTAIKFKIFETHNEMLNDDAVRKTLKGEANTHQEVDEALRDAAKAVVANTKKGGGKRKLDDADHAEIIERIDAGETGAEIAREKGVSSTTVNTAYRKAKGYRKAGLVTAS